MQDSTGGAEVQPNVDVACGIEPSSGAKARVGVIRQWLADIDAHAPGIDPDRDDRINDLVVDLTISVWQLADELDVTLLPPLGFDLAAAFTRSPASRN
jgi:hypothetical protein